MPVGVVRSARSLSIRSPGCVWGTCSGPTKKVSLEVSPELAEGLGKNAKHFCQQPVRAGGISEHVPGDPGGHSLLGAQETMHRKAVKMLGPSGSHRYRFTTRIFKVRPG